MKRIINKFKKLKKTYKLLYLINVIVFFISICFIIQGLLLLKNIETFLRIIIIVFIILSLFIDIFINILLLFSKKNKLFIANIVFVLFISILFVVGSLYINKTYFIIDNMSKDNITYSTSLITMKDQDFKDSKNFKVGMISNENDIEGNILANKLIEKKHLQNIDLIYYDDYLEMLGDLYNNIINGLFISSNYNLSYSNYENYKNITNETKIIYSYKENMKNQDFSLSTNKSLTSPFTLLILGVDSEKEGFNKNTIFNGDTIMLVTFNPSTLNTTIFSIPRDTYVPIACNNNKSSKINSSAVGGTSCVINTVENLTGISIDYYVKINFKGVVNLVDALDGIEVDVPVSFCEQNSNREFGNNEICLEKGLQTLNGEQALALARHRHTLPLGDFQRVQHQQLVVESIAKKAKSIKNLSQFYNVLNTVSNNIETNIEPDQMLNLYNVAKKMLLNKNFSINIEKTYLTGYDLTLNIPGLGNVYTFQYYEESLNEIIKAMEINLELKEPEMIKTFNFSANSIYEVPVIGKQYYNVKRNEALPNFVGSSISYLKSWASVRNITVLENYVTEGMDGYDSLKDNIIISQNINKGTLVSSINSITVDVVKVTVNNNINSTENNNENTEINNTEDSTLKTTNET